MQLVKRNRKRAKAIKSETKYEWCFRCNDLKPVHFHGSDNYNR